MQREIGKIVKSLSSVIGRAGQGALLARRSLISFERVGYRRRILEISFLVWFYNVMATEELEKPVSSRHRALLRAIAAALVTLLLVAFTIHTLGIASVPNPHSIVGWCNTLCLVVIGIPMVFVLIGIICSLRLFELAGWGLLFILILMAITA